jgi:dihydrofolate reductase
MIIISAMTEDRIIGVGRGMSWNVPAEYSRYPDFVKGNTVIVGRKSYEIIASNLPAARIHHGRLEHRERTPGK